MSQSQSAPPRWNVSFSTRGGADFIAPPSLCCGDTGGQKKTALTPWSGLGGGCIHWGSPPSCTLSPRHNFAAGRHKSLCRGVFLCLGTKREREKRKQSRCLWTAPPPHPFYNASRVRLCSSAAMAVVLEKPTFKAHAYIL